MHSALFQTRADYFEDALEGAFGYRASALSEDLITYLDPPRDRTVHVYRRNPPPGAPAIEIHAVKKEDVIQEARLHAAVTCWYEHDEHESYAMWRVYGNDSFAVAVSTTVGALRACFGGAGNVVIGGVDYTPLPPNINSIPEMFFHKRPEFSYEREIRSVQIFPDRVTGAVQLQTLPIGAMDALLQNVIAAPGMRETSVNTIRGLFGVIQRTGWPFRRARFRRRIRRRPSCPNVSVNGG